MATQYTNLLYACRDCNGYKGGYWPSQFEKLQRFIILNPRLHKVEKYLDKSDFAWKGKSNQGRWNIKRLRLDSSIRIRQRKYREDIEKTIKRLREIKQQLVEKAREIPNKAEAEKEINDLASEIKTLECKIFGPMD